VLTTSLKAPFAEGRALLRIGVSADPPAGAYAAHYDDVTLTGD
jgi:hypothetical protein